MSENGVQENKIDDYLSRVNELSNLQLLEATQNIEKKDKPFLDWLDKKFANQQEREHFLIQNHIDLQQDLNLQSFLEFLDNRRKKLKNELIHLLGKKN